MKSSGLTVYSAVSKTMIDSAILKLKKISSTMAGSGKIIIDSIMMMISGAAIAFEPGPDIQAGIFRLFIVAGHWYLHLLQRG